MGPIGAAAGARGAQPEEALRVKGVGCWGGTTDMFQRSCRFCGVFREAEAKERVKDGFLQVGKKASMYLGCRGDHCLSGAE